MGKPEVAKASEAKKASVPPPKDDKSKATYSGRF